MPNMGEDREVDVIGTGKIMKKIASDVKDQVVEDQGTEPVSIVNASKDFTKQSSASPIRTKVSSKTRLTSKKFGDDVGASGKSPIKDSSKKKKKGSVGVDKETRDLVKNMEGKIEDLRK